MTRLIFNVVILIASIAVVFIYIKPTYEDSYSGIVALQEKKANLLQARSDLDVLKKKQTELFALRNEISQNDLNRLERMLPKEINQVLFIMELDTIARDQGMSLKNIKFNDAKKEATALATPSATPKKTYETFTVTFDISGRYQNFNTFLGLIEQGLRVTDVTSITLVANDKVDIYQYTVKVQTYWMK